MKNNFTYENTKDATGIKFGQFSKQFIMRIGDVVMWQDGDTSNGRGSVNGYYIDLTDQTDRGYPTLEWFLKCGFELEVGDEWSDSKGELIEIGVDEVNAMNFANPVDKICYVKSLHDNRHDLTAMARDEYYAKKAENEALRMKQNANARGIIAGSIETPEEKEALDAIEKKQWPNNERIDVIGQNGNNGEHYPHESESPLSPNFECKPVYTQEMHERGELPPVGCKVELKRSIDDLGTHTTWESGHILECLAHKRCPLTSSVDDILAVFWNETTEEASTVNIMNVKPIDTKTDEEKLRDALIEQAKGYSDSEGELFAKTFAIDSILNSDKFTVTLND